MDYEEYRKQVVTRVTERLKHHTWFRGVCRDSIKNCWDNGMTVDDAVECVDIDTQYYDNPIPW